MTRKCSIHTRAFFSLVATMALVAMLGLLCRPALATPGGSGTEGDPYTVGNAEDLQTALNSGGFVKLTDSIGGSFLVSNNKTVDLDLNGKTIHHTGSEEDTLTIASGCSVTIRDKSQGGGGKVTASGKNAVNALGTLTMYGGAIESTESESHDVLSAVAVASSATFTMHNGSVSTTTEKTDVGCIDNNGTFTMYGGSVSGSLGYGVKNSNNGVFTLASGGAGGTITGGTRAIDGTVQNKTGVTGWTDVAGTKGQTNIPANGSIGNTLKKVQFPPVSYTVSVSMNPTSGAGTTSGAGKYTCFSSATLSATPQTGYKFVNWTKDGAEASKENPYTIAVEGDVSLVANFERVTCKVTFVDDDGTVLKEATEYDYGTKAADIQKPATPTKPATAQYTYEFAGWDPAIADVTADATYKATYTATPKKATLTFELNGGTLNGQTGTVTITPNIGETINLPEAPTRDGYLFRYWKGSEYAAGAEYTVEGDHTFSAEWAPKTYPAPTMTNSKGGNFASTSDEITYTIFQEVPDWVSSLRTWVDLDPVLQYTSGENDVTVTTTDGAGVNAWVSIEGQKLTVTVDDATALRGKKLQITYKAKVRSGANLNPYLNSSKDTASVPYQAHTVFDGEENHTVVSNIEYVKFKTGSSSSSGTSATKKASTTKAATAATSDPTSFATALALAAAGTGFWIAGWRRRR